MNGQGRVHLSQAQERARQGPVRPGDGNATCGMLSRSSRSIRVLGLKLKAEPHNQPRLLTTGLPATHALTVPGSVRRFSAPGSPGGNATPTRHPQHQGPVPGSFPGKEEHPPRPLRGRSHGAGGGRTAKYQSPLGQAFHPQCEPPQRLPGLALISDS